MAAVRALVLAALALSTGCATGGFSPLDFVTRGVEVEYPPVGLKLDSRYEKYVDACGIPSVDGGDSPFED